MKKIVTISILILYAQFSTAQLFGSKTTKGNGKLITKTFTTSDYDAINLTGFMDVELIAGKEGAISVTAESNLMDLLKIEVKDGKLLLTTRSNANIKTTKGILIKVPVEKISSATVSGSGEIKSDLLIKSATLDLKVSGSGELKMTVESANLKASVTGSGDMELRGRTENLEGSVTGSGDLKAYDLKANNINANVTGSGDISVYCAGGELDARVTGSGDIRYKGNVKQFTSKITGSGDITKM